MLSEALALTESLPPSTKQGERERQRRDKLHMSQKDRKQGVSGLFCYLLCYRLCQLSSEGFFWKASSLAMSPWAI